MIWTRACCVRSKVCEANGAEFRVTQATTVNYRDGLIRSDDGRHISRKAKVKRQTCAGGADLYLLCALTLLKDSLRGLEQGEQASATLIVFSARGVLS